MMLKRIFEDFCYFVFIEMKVVLKWSVLLKEKGWTVILGNVYDALETFSSHFLCTAIDTPIPQTNM
jgi:hypothetical protein